MSRWITGFLVLAIGMTFMNSASAADDASQKLLRHVVLFKFKDSASKEQVDEVVKAFAGLKDKIDTIVDFEWGTDVSVENKAAGFTHCFVVSFHSAKDRDEYLPHPAHKEFVKLVGGRLDNVLVVDFWVKKTAE